MSINNLLFKKSEICKFTCNQSRRMINRLVVIIGCTGTGKSDLGIAIAKKFNGEIINADSMQIYKGLDIATNKVTEAEMENVPHHMLSFLEPSCSTFNVFKFREEVLKIIRNLWTMNKLPILVGGTAYYVESILYKNYLIETNSEQSMEHLDKLNNDELYEYLKRIDRASAEQIHKNNRLRVKRAIQIYESTHIRKSEHLAVQQGKSEFGIGGVLRFPHTILFFLDAEKETLVRRLNARVEKMVKRGLRDEIENFYDQYSATLTIHGVSQSIALKEFVEYLQLDRRDRRSEKGDELFEKGCDLLKLHTRQYSRKQRSWAIQRLLRRANCRNIPLLVTLDTTKDFWSSVVPYALDLVQRFFDGTDNTKLDYPINFIHYATRKPLLQSSYQKEANQIYHCELCSIDIQGKIPWEAHLKGRRHKVSLRKRLKFVGDTISPKNSII